MNTAFDKIKVIKLSIKINFILIVSVFLFSCTSPYQAPMAEVGTSQSSPRIRNVGMQSDGNYRVNSGETLYSIAFQFDLDYTALANANGIVDPFTIYPEQMLSLDVSNNRVVTTRATNTATAYPAQTQRTTTRPASSTDIQETAQTNTRLTWIWPSKGLVINDFSTTGVENKGIDIGGKTGDDVLATEAGEVVYAGSGLLRYGDLLIIKHNSQYLSAYAHNSKLLVTEGDKVTRGQKIAALGSTGIDKEMLHFEIRNNGIPVDPMNFLPGR